MNSFLQHVRCSNPTCMVSLYLQSHISCCVVSPLFVLNHIFFLLLSRSFIKTWIRLSYISSSWPSVLVLVSLLTRARHEDTQSHCHQRTATTATTTAAAASHPPPRPSLGRGAAGRSAGAEAGPRPGREAAESDSTGGYGRSSHEAASWGCWHHTSHNLTSPSLASCTAQQVETTPRCTQPPLSSLCLCLYSRHSFDIWIKSFSFWTSAYYKRNVKYPTNRTSRPFGVTFRHWAPSSVHLRHVNNGQKLHLAPCYQILKSWSAAPPDKWSQ